MLSPADAALAQRDPALPGLATLLDAPAFADVLRRVWPDAAIRDARPCYVRYKPGTSCVVAYDVATTQGEVAVYGKAFSGGRRSTVAAARALHNVPGPLGGSGCVLGDRQIVVFVAPHDPSLPALVALDASHTRPQFLQTLLPEHPDLWNATVRRLRYKPERRFVAQLLTDQGAGAVVKLYTRSEYRAAVAGATAYASAHNVRLARLIGRSDRECVLVWEWLPGQQLTALMDQPDACRSTLVRVGSALAELHAQPASFRLATHVYDPIMPIVAARSVAVLHPALAAHAKRVAFRLTEVLPATTSHRSSIHGDFYADQVLVSDQGVAILDLDNAAIGDPAVDVGSFAAHAIREALNEPARSVDPDDVTGMLLEGYAMQRHDAQRGSIQAHTAAGLLRLAVEPFRRREPDWPERIAMLLQRAEEMSRYAIAA
jgi:hypothetical protein